MMTFNNRKKKNIKVKNKKSHHYMMTFNNREQKEHQGQKQEKSSLHDDF